MTTTYAVLLPGDEKVWADASAEERARVYGLHNEFTRLLGERGHKLVGGAELADSSQAKVLRGTLDQVSVTDGPYAETVEQLTGFYLVETDDLDDLLNLCGLLSEGEPIEVRACVDPSTTT
jgi:hypothetical protein